MNLCRTCRSSTIVTLITGTQIVHCSDLNARMPSDVEACNSYSNKSDVTLRAMENTAWILETSKGRKIGFVPAQEWSRSHPHEDVTPGVLAPPGQHY
jgi:hypothetical protein